MPLPNLIEIIPLAQPVRAEITVPGSKSITNRALILAALADGTTILKGALWSDDTQVMTEALQKLGFDINVAPDPDESCNRTITVKGLGGNIPNAGTAEKPLELFVGNAGTAARFLSALVCLGKGVYRLHGIARMHERPKESLFKALRELGYRVESPNEKLPAIIHGEGPKPGKCTVNIEESSQFASALLLCATIADWKITIKGENAEESPYITMTSKLIDAFPKKGGEFQIEPDASSGSYFWGVGWLFPVSRETSGQDYITGIFRFETDSFGRMRLEQQVPSVHVKHWPNSGWQIDQRFTAVLLFPPQFRFPEVVSRNNELGDSIMTAITLTPFANELSRYTDLGRLRLQETERVHALKTELTKCGAKVVEEGDTLTVYPSKLHGAEIETYDDHRMAMCFAILGLKLPGIKIQNPACVKKTFPNFFQKLAAQPPKGLGATIRDVKTGRALSHDELFAD